MKTPQELLEEELLHLEDRIISLKERLKKMKNKDTRRKTFIEDIIKYDARIYEVIKLQEKFKRLGFY